MADEPHVSECIDRLVMTRQAWTRRTPSYRSVMECREEIIRMKETYAISERCNGAHSRSALRRGVTFDLSVRAHQGIQNRCVAQRSSLEVTPRGLTSSPHIRVM